MKTNSKRMKTTSKNIKIEDDLKKMKRTSKKNEDDLKKIRNEEDL